MRALAIGKKLFFQDIKCSDSPFNRSTSKMQMQMKCIHIYNFIGCMTGPPLASGALFTRKRSLENQHTFVFLFK